MPKPFAGCRVGSGGASIGKIVYAPEMAGRTGLLAPGHDVVKTAGSDASARFPQLLTTN